MIPLKVSKPCITISQRQISISSHLRIYAQFMLQYIRFDLKTEKKKGTKFDLKYISNH